MVLFTEALNSFWPSDRPTFSSSPIQNTKNIHLGPACRFFCPAWGFYYPKYWTACSIREPRAFLSILGPLHSSHGFFRASVVQCCTFIVQPGASLVCLWLSLLTASVKSGVKPGVKALSVQPGASSVQSGSSSFQSGTSSGVKPSSLQSAISSDQSEVSSVQPGTSFLQPGVKPSFVQPGASSLQSGVKLSSVQPGVNLHLSSLGLPPSSLGLNLYLWI